MSSTMSNQKPPRSYSTLQPDTPLVRRLSGQPSLWLKRARLEAVAEPPPNITIRGTKKGAKGGKKGQKRHLHCLAAMANNINVGEEIKNFDEEFVVTEEHNFKRRT
jgi:hypothetical protein